MHRAMFCVLIVGCVSKGHLDTPSGRPEAKVKALASTVQAVCVADLIRRGWLVEQNSPNMVVAYLQSDNPFAATMYGSAWRQRTATIVGLEAGVTTLYASDAVVTNKGSGFQHSEPLERQRDFDDLRDWLVQIAAEAERVAALPPAEAPSSPPPAPAPAPAPQPVR